MRFWSAILLLALCWVPVRSATLGYANAFATFGNYTNGRVSEEYAGYASLSWSDSPFLTLAYSQLDITHDRWTYRQRMGIAGLSLRHQQFRLKVHYGHSDGAFSERDAGPQPSAGYHYDDRADLGCAEILYPRHPVTLGFAYSQFSGQGFTNRVTRQYTARYEETVHRRVWFSLRPSYVWTLDGRRLLSTAFDATWQPQARWILRAGGSYGERAYYFNNDLLVLFNQDETQKGLGFAQMQWQWGKHLWLTGEFVYTEFEDYVIHYHVIGVQSRWPL